MPTYQYTCTDCGTPLEVVQSFTDPALTTCPTCGGKLRKVFSAVGVVFKGSGFYRNDSRENGKAKSGPAKVDANASGDSGATTSDASSKKPAVSSDAKAGDSSPKSAPAGPAAASKSGSASSTAPKKPSSTSSSAA